MLLARNICRAVAELHQMNIIHGDIASENILVNSKTFDVKLIDFDLARIEGTAMLAGGNCDFVTKELDEAINKGKRIKVSKKNDLYSLALICFLVVGDVKRLFFKSLSGL